MSEDITVSLKGPQGYVVTIPKGYRWIGKVRRLKRGDSFIWWNTNTVSYWTSKESSNEAYPIIKLLRA